MYSSPRIGCLNSSPYALCVLTVLCSGSNLSLPKLCQVWLWQGSQCGAMVDTACGQALLFSSFAYRRFVILTWCDSPEGELNWQEYPAEGAEHFSSVMEARKGCSGSSVLTGTGTIQGCPAQCEQAGMRSGTCSQGKYHLPEDLGNPLCCLIPSRGLESKAEGWEPWNGFLDAPGEVKWQAVHWGYRSQTYLALPPGPVLHSVGSWMLECLQKGAYLGFQWHYKCHGSSEK